MADLKQCELLLMRYSPKAVQGEAVNLAVVLFGEDGFADVRFTRDWRRLRCLDPDADFEMLQALEDDLRRVLALKKEERDWIYTKLREYCSNAIEFAPVKACLTADPQQEMEALARMYLERRAGGKRTASGRQVIFERMREAFELAGVWPMMFKRIAAAKYTHAGDPLKIDCGYRPNGVIRMFQAVSLATDVDAAKVLAFSFPQLREGMARVDKIKAEMTAVVEDGLDRGDEAIGFALAVLAQSQVAVRTSSEMPEIAERARVELRA